MRVWNKNLHDLLSITLPLSSSLFKASFRPSYQTFTKTETNVSIHYSNMTLQNMFFDGALGGFGTRRRPCCFVSKPAWVHPGIEHIFGSKEHIFWRASRDEKLYTVAHPILTYLQDTVAEVIIFSSATFFMELMDLEHAEHMRPFSEQSMQARWPFWHCTSMTHEISGRFKNQDQRKLSSKHAANIWTKNENILNFCFHL